MWGGGGTCTRYVRQPSGNRSRSVLAPFLGICHQALCSLACMLVPGWVPPNWSNEMGQWWVQRGRMSMLGLFQSRRGTSPLRDEQCEVGHRVLGSLMSFANFVWLFDKVLVVFSPLSYPGWPKPLPVPLLGRMCQLLSSNCSLAFTLVELSSKFFKGRPLGHGATLCVVALVEAEPF